MSTQSIYDNKKETLDKTIVDYNIKKSKDYIFTNKFGIKRCYDFKTSFRLNWLHRIVCDENCLIEEERKCLNGKLLKLTLN